MEQAQRTTSTKAAAVEFEHKIKLTLDTHRKDQEKSLAKLSEQIQSLEERRLRAIDARMDKMEANIIIADLHALEAGQRLIALEGKHAELAEYIHEELPPGQPPVGPATTASDDDVIVMGRATSVAEKIEAAGPARMDSSASASKPRASRSAASAEIELDPA